jgi:hypothetical protein
MRKTKPPPKATPTWRRTSAEMAAGLVGLERQRQDAVLARLAETEQCKLHGPATEQLQVLKPGAGVRLPTGQTRLVFRPPVASRLQAADYVCQLSRRLLESIAQARWALQAQQPPDLPSPRRRELRAIANAALLDVEQVRSRLTAYRQRDQLAHVEIMRRGKPKGSRSALGRVVEAYLQHAPVPQRTPEALWDHLHALADADHATIHDVLNRTTDCHPRVGAHVDWWIAPDRLRATTQKGLRAILRDVARALALPLAR